MNLHYKITAAALSDRGQRVHREYASQFFTFTVSAACYISYQQPKSFHLYINMAAIEDRLAELEILSEAQGKALDAAFLLVSAIFVFSESLLCWRLAQQHTAVQQSCYF